MTTAGAGGILDGAGRSRPAGTVAFVFTDIEGSTAAWESDPEAMGAAVARLDGLVDEVAAHGARALEQGAGDSAVLAFARPTDAAAAALALQRAIAVEAWPTLESVRVRMALHVGEVEGGSDGVYRGMTMNRCGRLLATAHGGQIVASGSLVALLDDSVSADDSPLASATWRDLGHHRLRGIERPMQVWQMEHPDLEADFPPLRTVEGRGLHLPSTSSVLIGRDEDLAGVEAMLGDHRLVSLVGSGGSGKTRLTIEAAQRAIDDFDDVHWIDLAKSNDPAGIVPLIVTEMALHHGAPDPRMRIVNHLRARRALVVFDNCEHVIAPVAALVDELLSQCPAIRILTTSREPLEVHEETIWRLGPLAVPTGDSAADLAESDAGALLLDRIARVRPRQHLTADDAAAAAEICRRLDGIPLALELAAARSRSMPLAVIADRLEERFALLAGGGRVTMARQRTLEASVAWSHDLLDDDERLALARLSTFAGPFDLDGAAAVLGTAGLDVSDVVAALVDKSLLAEQADTVRTRFAMLETVRNFARARCLEIGETAACRDRHLAWVEAVCVAEGAGLEGPDAREAARRIDDELEEIRAALEWAVSTDRAESALTITSALNWYWLLRGLLGEGQQWLDLATQAAQALGLETSPNVAAQAVWCAVCLAGHLDPNHEAIEVLFARAEELTAAADERGLEVRVRLMHAMHECILDPVANRSMLESAVERCHDYPGFWSCFADTAIAQADVFQVQLRAAQAHLDDTEPAARALASPLISAERLSRRALIAQCLGDYDAAIEAAAELDRVLEGITLGNVRAFSVRAASFVQLHRGDIDGVAARLEAGIAAYFEEANLLFIPPLAEPLAASLIAAGRPRVAVALLQQIWDHPEVQRSLAYVPIVPTMLAIALWSADDRVASRALAEETIARSRDLGSRVTEADATFALGVFDAAEGDLLSAEARLHDSLETYAEFGHRQAVCDVLEELAGLEADFGRLRAGAILLGGASRERDEQGVVLRPWRQPAYHTTIGRTRGELGEEAFDEAWETGRRLPLDEVVALARRGRGERVRPTFGWDSLTDTEARVAALAADGLTNPQIAERLVMGRETVKTHIASVLRKLELPNRTHLAGAYARRSEQRQG